MSTQLPIFPILPGQGWSVKQTPIFSTKVATHSSGREVRSSLYGNAKYQFELTFDGLDSNGIYVGLQPYSLQALKGLYLYCKGQFGTFVYSDPTDNLVFNEPIAYGDGTTTSFVLQRAVNLQPEIVSWVHRVYAVYINGVSVPDTFTLTSPNTINLNFTPTNGSFITADFSYAYQCRFSDDQNEFENYMNGLWKVDSLKFESIKVLGTPIFFTQPSVYSVFLSQAKKELQRLNLLQTVNTYVQNLTGSQLAVDASMDWYNGAVVSYGNNNYLSIQTALGYTTVQMNNFMANANALSIP